jgi:putative glutamine amidotransferase
MKTIATWIRPTDEALFTEALAFAPGVRLVNARTTTVDLAAADALLLTGGGDIGRDYLRQEVPDPALIRGTDAPRDRWEFPAVAAFAETSRPILAICRGHQVLNVALGGTLVLDIPGHADAEQRDREVQALRIAEAVPAWRRFEAVNSSHHQAVAKMGEGLLPEAWCEADGIIEQMSHRVHPWCVGVQFHPERGQAYAGLFRAFVQAVTGRGA